MQLGIDSFVSTPLDPSLRNRETDQRRVEDLLEEIELADRLGLDVFAIGEHHRPEYISSAPTILLAAAGHERRRSVYPAQ